MPASTLFRRFTAIFPGLVLLCGSLHAFAAEQLVVEPARHPIPQVGEGLAWILAEQLNLSGMFEASVALQAEAAAPVMLDDSIMQELLPEAAQDSARYLVSIDVISFGLTTRDNIMDLGDDFNDLSRMFGGSDELAECRLHVRLTDLLTGSVLVDGDYSGRESRRGVRIDHLSGPLLRQLDYRGVQFHESNLGLATYKAIGAFLYDMYQRLPVQGRVLALSGDTAVVSLGGDQRISSGDELHALRIQTITDMSGKGVWDEPLKLATLRVLELREDRCLCLVLDGSLELREGDYVRPALLRWMLPDEADHASPAELYH